MLALIAGTPLAFADHGQTRPYEQQQCWSWETYKYEPCYDRDHDKVPDEIDKCPDEWAPAQFYDSGCKYINYPPKEQQFEGPDWILILVEWNEQKIIDDTTFTNALEWLIKHNILKLKQ